MTEHNECARPASRARRAASRRRLAGVAALFVMAAAAAGCKDPVEPLPDDLQVVWQGRAERGLSLVMSALTAKGDTLAPESVTWRVRPSSAGSWRGDTLRLERAGRITVYAEHGREAGAVEIDVAVPPAILFDMVVDGNRDLYRAALDGRDLERLTTHSAADYDPTVAGKHVVFVSERDGNKELYSLTLGGKEEKRLTYTAVSDVHPALSPDGRRLAFTRGMGLTRLHVAAPDASGAVRPDPTHGHDGTLENAPAWSPDGRLLAFVSTAGGNPDLYLWDGETTTLLESTAGGEFEPAFSPDGRAIAFSSNRTGDVELYLLDLEDRSVRRLTEREGSDGYPAWLPDGRIVYVAYTGSTPELRWLDPAAPGVTHPIPLPGRPGNPVAMP